MEWGVCQSIFPSLCRRFWGVEEEFRKIKGVRSTRLDTVEGGWNILHTSMFALIGQVTQKQFK
jgi:peptide methionine sulfoxide reductase MsrA